MSNYGYSILSSTRSGGLVGLTLSFAPYALMNGGTKQPLYINMLLITCGTVVSIPSMAIGGICGLALGITGKPVYF
jgi:hypothetical protein